MTFTPPSSIAPASVIVTALPLPSGAATEATLDRIKRAVNDIAAQPLDEPVEK